MPENGRLCHWGGGYEADLLQHSQISSSSVEKLSEYEFRQHGLHFMRESLFLKQVNLELQQVRELFRQHQFVSDSFWDRWAEALNPADWEASGTRAFKGLENNYQRVADDFLGFFLALLDAFKDEDDFIDFCCDTPILLQEVQGRLGMEGVAVVKAWKEGDEEHLKNSEHTLRRYFEKQSKTFVSQCDERMQDVFESLEAALTGLLRNNA